MCLFRGVFFTLDTLKTMQMHSTTRKGFSLVELLITLFIFGILMIGIADVFTQTFSGYRYAKNLQRDVESMQFITNAISKEIRAATIVSPTSSTGNAQSVQFYQHAQGTCVQYRINGRALEVARENSVSVAACRGANLGNFVTLSTGDISGGFDVIPSDDSPRRVGRVTMAFRIQQETHSAVIQSTVSLSDYGADGSKIFQ